VVVRVCMCGVAPGELKLTYFLCFVFVSIILYHPQLRVAVKRDVCLDQILIGQQKVGQNLRLDLTER
jgi:hypothetical protein